MEKIFHAQRNQFSSTDEALQTIFARFFSMQSVCILREGGKPHVKESPFPLFFSVTHTENHLFIAVSDREVGIDAENVHRSINYLPILRRFSLREQQEIVCAQDFLAHWTVKESIVKWLGGTLSRDLRKIEYVQGTPIYNGSPIRATVSTRRYGDLHIAICGERDFTHAAIEELHD